MRRTLTLLCLILLACWGVPTAPLEAQSPEVFAHEASDTTAGLRVRWPHPEADSVQAKTSGCYRVKVNGKAWGRWVCRYLTEPKQAVSGRQLPPPPPADSQPTPPDTVTPPPPTDTTPAPPPTGSHEPAGYRLLFENRFTRAIAPVGAYTVWSGPGEAGCWYTNGGTKFSAGKMLVTFAVGLAEGRTPADVEGFPVCPPARQTFVEWYFRLDGYQPGDGTPAWVNGEGTKAIFLRSDPAQPYVFKCDSPVRPVQSGVYDHCVWSLYPPGGTKRAPIAGSAKGVVTAGQPNQIECTGSTTAITCWVNGGRMDWSTGLPGGLNGVWLAWTYGGGGGGTPVGVRSVWSLDGVYASGR